jgi:uncharacterized protein YggE
MKKNNLIISVIAIIALVIISLMIIDLFKEKTTINVSGQSLIESLADESSIYIGIETLKNTAEESKNENAEISDKVLNVLLNEVKREDIETSSYNIYSEYNWDNGKQELRGYKTVNILKVKTKDFSKIGKIVDLSIDNGATNIQSINFELSQEKQNELKTEAIAKASEDARKKAEATAQGLNSKLGKIKQVTVLDYNYSPYPLYAMGSSRDLKETVSTEILPNKLEVRATINVVFELN